MIALDRADVAPLCIHRSGRVIVDQHYNEIAEIRPQKYHGDDPQELARRIAHACKHHTRLVNALQVAIASINADELPQTVASLQIILDQAQEKGAAA